MEFLNFCQSLGIIVNSPPPVGVWKRYPTVDHPRKRNGAVKFIGDHGFAQNHALDTEVSVWKDESVTEGAKRDFQKIADHAEQERVRMQKQAASKAAAILNLCNFGKHEYLKAKGFPDEEGNVYLVEGRQVLVIPMRLNGALVGCQMIDMDGTKKFLYGQRTAGATFSFHNRRINVVCEGYATALSIRAAMKQLKRRYTIHVCFSAGNMIKVAAGLESGLVIADNDKSGTGQQAAAEIGWPVWMSDRETEDANDCHRRIGLFKFSQSLTHSMLDIGSGWHNERQSTV